MPPSHVSLKRSISATPGEGKTTIAANLAHLLHKTSDRAVLVDDDLRRVSPTKRLAHDAKVGSIEVLDSTAPFTAAVWQVHETKPDLIPAVLHGAVPDSAALLTSPAVVRLLEKLRARDKHVVGDFPLLAIVANDVLRSAELIRARMPGAVLNKAGLAAMAQFEPSRAGGPYHVT
jgi:succinoglycan biosynthesis transport protein ExoP